MVNRYMRPKGLSSYKLARDASESELDFQRRRDMHQYEKDKKSQF